MNACTIIAKNYLAHARVLAASFREHHPDGRLTVLVLDEVDGHFDPADEEFDIVTSDDLDLPEFPVMAGTYDVLELSTAVKPWLLRKLLEERDHVVYLDPDIQIFAPCDEVVELARDHGMVLTPHNVAAMPRDGKKPSETDILIAGAYNLGFIALARGEATTEFIAWWAERLRTDCVVDTGRGYFVDQRWIDLVPGMVPSVWFLRDPSYNVAYWNLYTRTIERNDGAVAVNELPLKFFHFSGYDPDTPGQLSKHQNRVQLADDPDLRSLCDDYGAALKAHGYDEVSNWPYSYAKSAGGMTLTRAVRRLYADAVRAGVLDRSLFDVPGEEALAAYAVEPVGADSDPRITRFMAAVHASRPDLQAAFPTLHGSDAEWLLRWFAEDAPSQLGDTIRLVGEIAAPGAEAPGAVDDLPPGVNVVGYFTSELGVGEVARQAIGALDSQGVPLLPMRLIATASRQDHAFAYRAHLSSPYPINLLCVNADQIPSFAREAGEDFFRDRHTIGWWWWEVEQFPAAFDEAFQHVDEVWAGSRFVADALAAVSPVPVVHVPMPVRLRPGIFPARDRLGIALESFVYLYVFDYNSVFERKNPLGVVEAYTRAFSSPGEGTTLVLKCINADRHPEEHRRVREAIDDRPDILLIDAYLSADDKDALIASCDCYVSLHRSEGFGITLAEAMLLGKPVVATGYSGNLDFMHPDNSYLVDHELVPIGAGNEPYPSDGVWARPDLEHAAKLLREVFDDCEEAARRAAVGHAYVARHHSPVAAGQVMARRLLHVRGALETQPPAEATAARARADTLDLVRRGPARSARAPWSPSRIARGVVVRAAKPLLARQRETDEAILWSVGETARAAAEMAEFARTQAETAALAEVRRLDERLDRGRTDGLSAWIGNVARHVEGLQEFADRIESRVAASEELVGAVHATPFIAGLARGSLVHEGSADEPLLAPPEQTSCLRIPPPERPWTHEYNAAHRGLVSALLDDPRALRAFSEQRALPSGLGAGFDERVVEYPWLFSQPLTGCVLDAGSVLNHEHILERLMPRVDELTIVTLEPEEASFPERRISYVYSDLRSLPFRDGWFDTVVCLSTLEHVGMDNSSYGSQAPRARDPARETAGAAAELRRVVRPGGRLLVSVPYGKREDHRWLRQFDRADVDELLSAFAPARHRLDVFAYTADGWRTSSLERAGDAVYRDFTADPSPAPDRAAAARAVVCLAMEV